jgi:uroporphyrinogen decarboxylase
MKKQILLERFRSDKTHSLPILTFPAVQIMGISVRELVESAPNQAKAMVLLSERYPMFCALSMMDLSVEAEAFGSPIKYYDMDIPTVTGAIIHTLEDSDRLRVPSVSEHRTQTYVEGVKLAKMQLPNQPLLAGVIGPFSLAGRLMDMTEIMVNCFIEPEWVHKTLRKATQFIIDYILAFKAAGADGIIMAEPAAGLLSPDTCAEFSCAYIKEIMDAVASDDFLFIYHNCGNVVPLQEPLIALDADVYHFGDHIDLVKMLEVMPQDKIIMGNISPSTIFRKGTPDMIRTRVKQLLDECGRFPNFVISSGCDIPPETPLENIDAFFEAVSSYNRKP